MARRTGVLMVDEYRPKDMKSLDVHTDTTARLERIAKSQDFPHLLFYGPSGAGKKTRVMALLREHYGVGVSRLRIEQRSVQATSSKTIDVSVLVSPYHIEVNPAEAGVYDRAVVMNLVKELAESAPLMDTAGKRGFKVVVISEVDRLTRTAQQALRRTMEKYMSTCRLILVATSLSRVMAPLRSRCLAIRVPLPSTEEVGTVLSNVAKKEKFVLPEGVSAEIVQRSGRNMRRALLCLEATKVQRKVLQDGMAVFVPEWERFVAEIATEICHEQTPKRVWEVRGKLYELLTNCIPPEEILERLILELLKHVDSPTQIRVASAAAHYDHALRTGSRPIIHLEAFVCEFMALYRTYLAHLARSQAQPPRRI